MKRFRKFLWVTDPWDTLDHARDTTLRLAEESLSLGHESWWCDVKSIRLQDGKVLLDAAQFKGIAPSHVASAFHLSEPKVRSPLDFHSIQYRVDPPVDLAFLQPLQMIRLAIEAEAKHSRRPEIVNSTHALFLANEKLEGTLLPGLSPPQAVSAQWEKLQAFGMSEGRTVMKPLHLAQSRGIELLEWTSKSKIEHARALIAEATDGFERPVLLQRYLPGIKQGETRLWLLDGKLLASVRKLPLKNDFRVNIDQGSRLAPHTLTASEKKAALAIGKHLKTLKVRLAAVDLIDDLITDFNLTSPGLIAQMEKVTGRNLARPIIEALAKPLARGSGDP